ncbi:MAG: thermonuclease family protein [Candidatus Nanopelagicales bacterium]
MKRLLCVVAAATLFTGLPVTIADASSGQKWAEAVDGDTVQLLNGRYVRLLGIDTPEVGQCGYDAAKARMTKLVKNPVRLVNRSGKDKYGRILAYLRTKDGRDIGTVMLSKGLAVARYDSLDGYPWHPRQARYRALDASNGQICNEPAASPTPTPTPTPTTTSTPYVPFVPPITPTAPPVTPPVTVYYPNCDAVRRAGKAPLYRGQPGYGPHLDRDGDGVACE